MIYLYVNCSIQKGGVIEEVISLFYFKKKRTFFLFIKF